MDLTLCRDMENIVHYIYCVYLCNVQTAVSGRMHTDEIMSALLLATTYSSWSGPSVSNSYIYMFMFATFL